jgi:hypothetical protein
MDNQTMRLLNEADELFQKKIREEIACCEAGEVQETIIRLQNEHRAMTRDILRGFVPNSLVPLQVGK